MEEETKNEIVKKVLEELKNKKLLKNPKSSYKSTEKILYSLNVLPEAIKLIDEEVKKLEEEAKGIAIQRLNLIHLYLMKEITLMFMEMKHLKRE